MKRILQVTNAAIPTVAIGTNMPLGVTTINCSVPNCNNVFDMVSSNADVILINRGGYYKVTYNASIITASAGNLTLSLKLNGVVVNVFTITTVVGTNAVAFTKYIYIPCNCQLNPNVIPARLELTLDGVQVTSGTSNIIVEG